MVKVVVDQELERDKTLLSGSYFFDEKWYLRHYPDIVGAGLDALEHYLRFGAAEARDPGPFFSTRTYLSARPDVAAAGSNPLVHFLRYGVTEITAGFQAFGVQLYGDLPEPPLSHGPSADQSLAVVDPVGLDLEPPLRRPKGGPKAVFVTHDLNFGGAPTVLASVASWFQRCTDYDVRIVSMGGGPQLATFEQIAPVHIVGHMEVADEAIAPLKAALKSFLGEEPAFTFINSVAGGDYCRIDPFEAPIFGYIHEMPKILAMFERQFQNLLSKAAHVFCGGEAVHHILSAFEGVNEAILSNRPAFIDRPVQGRSLSARDKVEHRRALGWAADTKIVIGCGVVHWRKQPEVFVRLAAKVLNDWRRDARFVWIGDGEDLAAVRDLAFSLGVSDRVEFLGHRDDYRTLFAAADVFALTSSEDPFPLVCLEAAVASAPSVIFREATGMTAVVEPEGEAPGGLAEPLGDEEAYFRAVDRLLHDDPLRESLARTARDRVLAKYTTDVACGQILNTVRRVGKLKPKVSIVVPSYNCGPYLQKRLDSIADQIFQDVEILLLDDKSSDNSRDILMRFASDRIDTRLIFAEQNSGSVFRAWERGVHAAIGDLVWIAEADDWCEPSFLKRAVDAFSQSGVRLVHGRSIPVDERGDVAGDWNDLYLDRIAPGRWRRSFCEPAAKEINLSLGRANTIPNASAVVVRRASALRAIEAAVQFKLAGDWAFYVVAIAGGRIAYCNEAINYHRRHQATVTSSLEGKFNYFQELANVGALIHALFGANADRDSAFHAHVQQEASRFGFGASLPEGRLPNGFKPERPPGVLFGVGDLSGGGAQMFAIRFVNRWLRTGAPAVLFVAGYEKDHAASRAHISPEVVVVGPQDIESAGGLSPFMGDWGLDVVISGHWWADRAIGAWMDMEASPPPWVIVMHGCYESVLSAPDAFPGMLEDFARAERHCAHWVWTAPKNRKVFDEGFIEPRRLKGIVNGFEPVAPSGLGRAQLGLPDDAVVFTLASRAIEEKGWRVALEAFREVRARHRGRRDVRLQLIGDGPMAEAIAAGSITDGLHLVNHTARLADYICASDVCLLPSWFVGESLPLVVIEFLAQGKPAIVSDIGMCAWAIRDEASGASAGLVVPLLGPDSSVAVADLAAAMDRFVTDPGLAGEFGPVARRAFGKFDLDRMIGEYGRIFQELLAPGDASADTSYFP